MPRDLLYLKSVSKPYLEYILKYSFLFFIEKKIEKPTWSQKYEFLSNRWEKEEEALIRFWKMILLGNSGRYLSKRI